MPHQSQPTDRPSHSGFGFIGIAVLLIVGLALAGACFAPASLGFN